MSDNHIPMKLASGAWVCTCLTAARFMRLGAEAMCEHVLQAQARQTRAPQREPQKIHKAETVLVYNAVTRCAECTTPNGKTFKAGMVTKEEAQEWANRIASRYAAMVKARNSPAPARTDRMIRPTDTVQ